MISLSAHSDLLVLMLRCQLEQGDQIKKISNSFFFVQHKKERKKKQQLKTKSNQWISKEKLYKNNIDQSDPYMHTFVCEFANFIGRHMQANTHSRLL